MSRAEDQPWSPFPVQDWSRLPEDPLATRRSTPAGDRHGRLGPGGSRWSCGGHRCAGRRGGVRRPHGRPRLAADGGHGLSAGRRHSGVRAGRDHPRTRDHGQLPGHRVRLVQRRHRAAEHRHQVRHPAASRRPTTSATRFGSGGPPAPPTTTRPPRTPPRGCTGPTPRSSCWGRAGRGRGTSTGRRWSSCPRRCGPARDGTGQVRPTTSLTTGVSSGPRTTTAASR